MMKKIIFTTLLSAQIITLSALAVETPNEVNTTTATEQVQAPSKVNKVNAANETDFDSLGGNEIFFEKAKALQPEKKVTIVQNRAVDMKNRFELAPEFSGVFGGDTYSRTKSVGLNVHFHLNYNWSIGAKYNYSFNELTPEGKALTDKAVADYNANPESPTAAFPELNYQKSEAMALINWYPVYGKFNMMDYSVVHFDFYLVGGYGQIELSKSSSPTYTAGTGLGLWMTNNFSTRFEMRYQNYTSKYLSESKKMDVAVASVQMGWLL
jgi:outer membrane beta-barrel protein